MFNQECHPPASTRWIVAAYNQGRALPLVPAWTELHRVWADVMGPVWNNEVSVRDGLREGTRQMRVLLAG